MLAYRYGHICPLSLTLIPRVGDDPKVQSLQHSCWNLRDSLGKSWICHTFETKWVKYCDIQETTFLRFEF